MQQPRNLLFCSLLLINALHYATGLGVSISGHVKVGDNVGDFIKKLIASVDDGQFDPNEEDTPTENKEGLDMEELQRILNLRGNNKMTVVNNFGYADNREDMLREMNDEQRLSAGTAGHVYGVHDGEDEDEPQNVIEARL